MKHQQLKKYNGILGVFYVSITEETEIRIGVMFEIQEKINDDSSLFEIAFAEKRQLENDAFDWTVKTSLSIVGRRCNKTSKHICLVVSRRGVTYKKTEISKTSGGTYIGVVTMTKRSDDVVFHFSDKELQCKLLFKIATDHIFNKDIVPLYGVVDKNKYAKVILSVIRDAKNSASFDEMSSHKNIYTSGDGNAIANFNVGTLFKRGGTFHKSYRGVLGDIAFKEDTENDESFFLKPEYFEVKIHFDVNLRDLKSEDSLFEFGLTPKNLTAKHAILKYHSEAIIVTISRCTKRLRLCVMYWQEGQHYQQYNILHTYVEKYENYSCQFGFKIDPYQHQVSVYLIHEKKELLHDFRNVSFSRPLYPVFGMTDKTFVKMHLLSKSAVTNMYNVFGYYLQTPACEI